jgi:hypothetical protein
MAPLARTHVHVSTSDHLDSGSDSDAPEAVNTVQAKKGAKGRDDELKRFEAGERERRRELNRKRDEVLKARAAGAVGPKHTRRAEGGGGKGLDEEQEEGEGRSAAVLEARMQRAMAAAEEEDDDSENDMDDMGDEDAGMEDDLMDDEDDEEEDLKEELDLGGPSASHLPDHLFAALDRLPPPSASASASRMAKGEVASAPQSSRKRRRSRPKDIVLGYVFDHVLAHLPLSYRNPIPFRSSFKRLSSLLLLSIALYTMHSPFLFCIMLSRILDHGHRIYLHHSPLTIQHPIFDIHSSLPPIFAFFSSLLSIHHSYCSHPSNTRH